MKKYKNSKCSREGEAYQVIDHIELNYLILVFKEIKMNEIALRFQT